MGRFNGRVSDQPAEQEGECAGGQAGMEGVKLNKVAGDNWSVGQKWWVMEPEGMTLVY